MFTIKESQTYPKPILKLLSQPNTDGMLKTWFFLDSELLSVETDRLDSVWLMIINNTWLSMNQITG